MSSNAGSALNNLISVQPGAPSRAQPTWDESVVLRHEVTADRYHRLELYSPSIALQTQAGQFVMVSVPGSSEERILLPRPMAVHRRHIDRGTIELIFSNTGRGTAALTSVQEGSSLLLTGPLGRGFRIPEGEGDVLLIGRGIGICGVMTVVEDATGSGVPVTVVLSGSTRGSVIGVDDCLELGAAFIPVTDEEGSSAVEDLSETLRQRYSYQAPRVVMVCGSHRLLRMAIALGKVWAVPVQVSIEAHMACGLGYCHGCAAPIDTDPTVEGPLVCVDGPVFDAITQA